jgi:hypothetical protein
MSRSDILEAESLFQQLESTWKKSRITFAEHGGSELTGEGPCISHTHVNVIPSVPDEVLDLTRVGRPLLAQGLLSELPQTENSYFLIGREGRWKLYDAAYAPSQYLRQLLYTHYGQSDWNWQRSINTQMETKTLSAWTAAFSDKQQ